MTPARLAEITDRQQYAAEHVERYQLPPIMRGPAENNKSCYATDVGDLLAEREQLRKALRALLDAQNGPPLIRDEAHWLAAVERARGLLA